MKKIAILVIDNFSIVRCGIIRMLLSNEKKCKLVLEEARSLEETAEKVKRIFFNIVIVNCYRPKFDAEKIIKLVLKHNPATKIIGLFNQYDEEIIQNLKTIGIHEFILKSINEDELFKTIENVMNEKIFFNQEIIENQSKEPNLKTEVLLSKRELEVLKYIVAEYTNEEIAVKLFISKRTVDTHRQNLLHKIGVKNTAGLVKYAIEFLLIR